MNTFDELYIPYANRLRNKLANDYNCEEEFVNEVVNDSMIEYMFSSSERVLTWSEMRFQDAIYVKYMCELEVF